MTLASAIQKVCNEYIAVFSTTGYAFFGIQTHLVCILSLSVILNHQQNISDSNDARLCWIKLLRVQILYCVLSVLRILADVEIIPDYYSLYYIITGLTFLSLSLICWLVFIYSELSQNSDLIKSRRNKIISALPLAFNVVVVTSALFFGGSVNRATGKLRIGNIFPLLQLINFSYLFSSALIAAIRRNRMTHFEREMRQNVIFYPSVLMTFLIIQIIIWKIPIFCTSVLIMNIIVYMKYADSLVSIDPLTKIPNKNGMIRNLSQRLGTLNASDMESEKKLYVFAVDVDGLSSINSGYGRIEGDNALKLIAAALKKFQDEAHPCYVSRYYGDEFILIADIQDNDELELFVEHIRNYINNMATSKGLPYHIRVSIGWAKYEKFSKTETISGLLEEAAHSLNENQEQRRFQNLWTKN